jgi:hypothetical protein
MSEINGALGSSSTQYTNVPSLTVGGVVLPIISVSDLTFSSYSRKSFILNKQSIHYLYYIEAGAQYCGVISQAAISTAVNTQAAG